MPLRTKRPQSSVRQRLPLCLNALINTKDHSANNTSHSHEFFFLGWLRENA